MKQELEQAKDYFIHYYQQKEEPQDETNDKLQTLEQAAEYYAEDHSDSYVLEAIKQEAFKAGARWMKEQKPVEYLSKEKVFAIMKKLTSLSFCVPLGSDEEKQIHEITCDVRSLLDYPIEQKPVEWSVEEEPVKEEICSKCIHHKKNDDCYYPHGGIQRLINENGVYECTEFCEKEQKQPNVDLEKEIDKTVSECTNGYNFDWDRFARHFYELGRKGGSK